MKYFAGKKSRRIVRVTPHNSLILLKKTCIFLHVVYLFILKHVHHLGSLLVMSPLATTPSAGIMETFPELIFCRDGNLLLKIKQKLDCLSTKTGDLLWKVKLLSDVGVASLNQKNTIT